MYQGCRVVRNYTIEASAGHLHICTWRLWGRVQRPPRRICRKSFIQTRPLIVSLCRAHKQILIRWQCRHLPRVPIISLIDWRWTSTLQSGYPPHSLPPSTLNNRENIELGNWDTNISKTLCMAFNNEGCLHPICSWSSRASVYLYLDSGHKSRLQIHEGLLQLNNPLHPMVVWAQHIWHFTVSYN